MVTSELNDAIKGLYAGLREPKPARIDGCPCCTDPIELCRLLETPRAQLNADDLFDFVLSVFYTMGDSVSFRYFLPRVLEIAATDRYPGGQWFIEVVLKKLNLAAWTTWPEREQESVRRVLRAWFEDLTGADELDGGGLDSIICGLALSADALEPYFALLLQRPEALKAFFAENAHSFYSKGKLSNEFWTDEEPAMSKVVEWLKSPQVQTVVGAS